jgi:hypothetical protein
MGLVPWIKVKREAEYVGKPCEPFDYPDLCGSGLKPLYLYQMLPGEQASADLSSRTCETALPVDLYFLDWSGRMPRLSLAGLMGKEPAR